LNLEQGSFNVEQEPFNVDRDALNLEQPSCNVEQGSLNLQRQLFFRNFRPGAQATQFPRRFLRSSFSPVLDIRCRMCAMTGATVPQPDSSGCRSATSEAEPNIR
jgi:hypothetical protein